MKKIILMMAVATGLMAQVQAQENVTLMQVMYEESSPGVGSYPYRILVNNDYLRFDGGNDKDGYILFDRKQKQVVSVNHDDQSRFVIQPQASEKYNNAKIVVRTVHSTLDKSPKIQGVKAEMHDIVANETLCRQVLSFKGLMPNVTAAWKEYEDVMQAQNTLSLSRTPKNLQTDCFLTNNISHASLFLDYGLPFSIRSKDGTLRILKSYAQVTKSASFVGLPEAYREFGL